MQTEDVFLCGGVCLVATALFLAMASLVWIQPHLFLMGNNYLSHVYFCSLYDGFIFMGNIVILM